MTSRSVEQEHYSSWLMANQVTRYWLSPSFLLTLLLARLLGVNVPLGPNLFLLLAFILYNGVLVRLLQRRSRRLPDTLIYFTSLLLNTAILAAAIHFTGGIESILVPLTAVITLFSALFLTFSLCLLLSLAAAASYVTVLALEYAGFLPHYHAFPALPTTLYTDTAYVVMMGLGVVSVQITMGLIAGYLASRRRRHSEELNRMHLRLKEWNRDLELHVEEKTRSLRAMHEQLQQAYFGAVTAFMEALEAKDPYTRHHSHAVSVYAELIGAELGLNGERLQRLRRGCELHDIGKIAIPDSILLKQGPLTKQEYEIMKQHPGWGARILGPLTFLKEVTEVVYQEHERWDGRGYPCGLKGEAICLEARIVSVADAWDAMTSLRPYRAPMPVSAAVAELKQGAGTQFDPMVVEAFIRAIESGKLPPSPHQGPHHSTIDQPPVTSH